MTIREAERELGLYDLQIYWGVEHGVVHQVKAPGGKRTLYPEWELVELRGRLTKLYPIDRAA
jgi:hypothetical protein